MGDMGEPVVPNFLALWETLQKMISAFSRKMSAST